MQNQTNKFRAVTVAPIMMTLFRYWIIIIPLLLFVSPTDISLTHRVYGLLFFLIFFLTSYTYSNKRSHNITLEYAGVGRFFCVISIFIQILAVNFAIKYYTGSDIFTTVVNTANGINTYSDYQAYFAENEIGRLPILSRMNAILLLALTKLIFVINVANFFLKSSKINAADIATVLLSTLIYVTFGLARGTFFEIFEILCAYAYFISMTSARLSNKTKRIIFSKRFIITAIITALIFIALFIINTIRRYDEVSKYFDTVCSSNFCFTPIGVLPALEYVLFILTTYFANGAYTLAVLFEQTVIGNELLYLIPMQSMFFYIGVENSGVREMMCSQYVNCKFVWVPELTTILSIFGIFTVFLTNLLIPKIYQLELFMLRKFSIFGIITLYFLFIFLLSLPVANFYLISSSSIVCTVVMLALHLLTQKKSRVRTY